MSTRTSIVVRFHFEGIHSWPGVPEGHEAWYLKHPHRHLFMVQAVKEVTHEDRDVEIIQFKRMMKQFANARFKGPHTFSCEMMARIMVEEFHLVSCRVLEDGENGAIVEQV